MIETKLTKLTIKLPLNTLVMSEFKTCQNLCELIQNFLQESYKIAIKAKT